MNVPKSLVDLNVKKELKKQMTKEKEIEDTKLMDKIQSIVIEWEFGNDSKKAIKKIKRVLK